MAFLLFVLPKGITQKVIDKSTEFVPIVGPMYKWTAKARKVTKIADPVTATSRAVGMVVISCTGPVIKYPALCALWGISAITGGLTGNPVLIGLSLEFAEILLEEW